WTVSSPVPANRCLAPAVKEIHCISVGLGGSSVATSRPVATSTRRITPFTLGAASSFPSGVKAIGPVRSSCSLATERRSSQSRVSRREYLVPSVTPGQRPSGLIAILHPRRNVSWRMERPPFTSQILTTLLFQALVAAH